MTLENIIKLWKSKKWGDYPESILDQFAHEKYGRPDQNPQNFTLQVISACLQKVTGVDLMEYDKDTTKVRI